MKQIITIFCLAFALLIIQEGVLAQPTDGFTFRQNLYNYVTPEPGAENWTDIFGNTAGRGVEIAYNRNLSGNTWLVVPLKYGLAQYAPGRRNQMGGNLDLLIQNNLFRHGAFLNPTLSLGIGSTYNFDAEEFDFNMPMALGLNIRLMPNLYANLQTQFRFSMDNRPGWHHGAGIVVYFGEQNSDRDKDGIKDKEDKCPDIPGVAALMGCPDRDGDGITDAEDSCPDVPGIASLMGCPDRDGDGIADNEDDCPDVKGIAAFKGCPDTDSDGIMDSEDKCPTEAGPAATGGCPDRDSDGVADKDDACPDKPGDSAHKGCPDTDGDGIFDNDDRCPEVPGVAALKGCPEIKKEAKAKLERAVKLVQFESGKAVLTKSSYAVLDEVVSVMNEYKEYSLKLSGHTDSQGEDAMNQGLSEQRAKTCYTYLVSKGIAEARITSTGYGETTPVADNSTSDGRRQNRRVEFELFVK